MKVFVLLIINISLYATTVLGDSIAVGIKSVNPNYKCNAKVGISSSKFLKRSIPKDDRYIISLGSNPSKNLKSDLRKLRRSLKGTVVWIIPRNTEIPREIAKEYDDRTVDFKAGKDGIHPRSYKVFKGIL
jgi:hypothetical protein